MAASAEELKGYDHQFVKTPPNDLLCLICLCVARDPQQITCCGKVLCRGCLKEHKKRSNNCPQCGKYIHTSADKRSKHSTPVQEDINKMCISVNANGNGDGKGTHVSVYAYLMKGENDDLLTWPLLGQ